MTRILLAPTADLARWTLAAESVDLTVEAEYGAFVAEGRRYTAAHHQPTGPYAGTHVGGPRPSPCNDPQIPLVPEGVILVSHLDLDTFGGCMRAMGGFEPLFEQRPGFWNLAEYVDTRGPHQIAGASSDDLRALYAYWAWAKTSPRFPSDQVSDVTVAAMAAGEVLAQILWARKEERLAVGDAFRTAEAELNRQTFVRREGQVLVRSTANAADFCNHLYVDLEGVPAKAVVSVNRENGAVTLSLAEKIPGVSCRAIVQELWGLEAGGHDGIAGGPRGLALGEAGRDRAVRTLVERLEALE